MKSAFSAEETRAHYPIATISAAIKEYPESYADQLLVQKFKIIKDNYKGGLVVDLCCGNGVHLLQEADRIDKGIGIDFVGEFIDFARAKVREKNLENLEFIVSDARSLPLADNSVDMLYSLAALYVASDTPKIISEISRVLSSGARCVLEFGNINSLNAICVKAYPEVAPVLALNVSKMLELCREAGLRPIERRSFQILPLWADKPRWLKPLLAPFWSHVMTASIRGRLVDEWISGLPLLNRLAFRQVIVCEKVGHSSEPSHSHHGSARSYCSAS